MDTILFISQCLSQVQIRLLATCEGLTRKQVLWRPSPLANNIGFILWHIARMEDRLVSPLVGNAADLWEAEEWFRAFRQPIESAEPGDRSTLRSLAIPESDVLLGYLKSAHVQTQVWLSVLPPRELDAIPNASAPKHDVSSMLRHLITHKNNHHGQIDYIRGLQDSHWDLAPGTGISLPPRKMA